MEKYEEEANILALIRMYDERMEEYCGICKVTYLENENRQGERFQCMECKLQHPEYRRNILEKNAFIKFCYNLNPECAKKIDDRVCLSELLSKDGMLESVFASIRAIPERYFIQKDEKTHFEIMHQEKSAFLTAITSKYPSIVVANIEKALKTNQDLIETIFDADQLVTADLEAESSIWDNSCIKIRLSDLSDDRTGDTDFEEYSIYVAKKPQFITSEQLIKSVGE